MRYNDILEQADRITYLCGDINYTYVHFVDAPPLLYSRTLLDCLPHLPGLLRIHRKYAANPHYIVEYRSTLTDNLGEIRIGDTWLPLSRRRRLDVVRKLYAITSPNRILGLPPIRVIRNKPGPKPGYRSLLEKTNATPQLSQFSQR